MRAWVSRRTYDTSVSSSRHSACFARSSSIEVDSRSATYSGSRTRALRSWLAVASFISARSRRFLEGSLLRLGIPGPRAFARVLGRSAPSLLAGIPGSPSLRSCGHPPRVTVSATAWSGACAVPGASAQQPAALSVGYGSVRFAVGAAEPDLEVEVRRGGVAGHPREADDLALGDGPRATDELREVRVVVGVAVVARRGTRRSRRRPRSGRTVTVPAFTATAVVPVGTNMSMPGWPAGPP